MLSRQEEEQKTHHHHLRRSLLGLVLGTVFSFRTHTNID